MFCPSRRRGRLLEIEKVKHETARRIASTYGEFLGLNTIQVARTTLRWCCSVSCFTCTRHAICLRLLCVVGGRL
jgi:hypothetical protein